MVVYQNNKERVFLSAVKAFLVKELCCKISALQEKQVEQPKLDEAMSFATMPFRRSTRSGV
ncbi:unnamed protein product [Ilex paraguariensis]